MDKGIVRTHHQQTPEGSERKIQAATGLSPHETICDNKAWGHDQYAPHSAILQSSLSSKQK